MAAAQSGRAMPAHDAGPSNGAPVVPYRGRDSESRNGLLAQVVTCWVIMLLCAAATVRRLTVDDIYFWHTWPYSLAKWGGVLTCVMCAVFGTGLLVRGCRRADMPAIVIGGLCIGAAAAFAAATLMMPELSRCRDL